MAAPSGRRLNAGVADDADTPREGHDVPVIQVRWLTAFHDMPADVFDTGTSFWQSITGYRLSPRRGVSQEFATLIPPDGDPFLRVQRTVDGPPGCHLDVHVDHPERAAVDAVGAGRP